MDNVELLSGLTRHDFLKTVTMESVSVMAISPLDILACSPLRTGFLLPELTIDNPYIYRHTLNTWEAA